MAQAEPSDVQRPPRWLVAAVSLLAALPGVVYSYDFGAQIGGPLVGVVLALNGALFCSILAGALVERLARWWPATGRGQPPQGAS
jgi:hypothetical protein